MAAFDDCKYKWYLKYLYGVSESEKFFSEYGSLMHRLLENYLNNNMKTSTLIVLYSMEFNALTWEGCPSQKIRASYFKKGFDFLMMLSKTPDYLKQFEVIGVEQKAKFEVDGYKFVGFIDVVGKDDDGYIIMDHKSKDLKPRSKRKGPTKTDLELDDYLRQLYLYSTWVKDKYGEFPKKLMFNCFKEGKIICEEFNYEKYLEAIEWYIETIHSIEREENFYPSIDYFRCHNLCGCNEDCEYFDMETW